MDQNHLPDPFRVLGQEQLQSMQLLRNTLDVIQSIDTNDELDPVESLLELLNPVLYWFPGEVLCTFTGRPSGATASKEERFTENKLTERGNFFGATGGELLTSVKDDGSMPIGKVPTLAKRPANSTPFGIVGRPRIRVHEERKCRA